MTDSEDWEFRERCREYLKLSVGERIRRGFYSAEESMIDNTPWRSFNSMAEYRTWCEANRPDVLGLKRPPFRALDTDSEDAFKKLRRDGSM